MNDYNLPKCLKQRVIEQVCNWYSNNGYNVNKLLKIVRKMEKTKHSKKIELIED